MSDLRELAREEPGAFESVARARDDDLKELMLRILEEEQGGGRGD